MFALVSAFTAAVYILAVVFISFITLCTFNLPLTRDLFTGRLRRHFSTIEVLSSGVTESSLQLVAIKVIIMLITKVFGGFNYTLAAIVYYLDIINIGFLGVLFYEMLSDRAIADTSIKSIDSNATVMKSILCAEDLKKLINPFWSPDYINVHSNITYATNEEAQEALNATNQDFDQPRKMMLDIFTNSNAPKNRLQPVLIHIHGGAWIMGSKNIFYPHEKQLLTENNWVIINIGYRLAPKNAYPTHLMDVKRSLRWIKQNIANFGGDPDFIVLSGDSAGAHLAMMTSMTANEPKYQPGFENVDTSVKGVVSLSGALDLINEKNNALFFAKRVANLDHVDLDFLSQHSPLALVQKAKGENKLTPLLLVAGERDGLTEAKQSKAVKAAYDQANKDGHGPSCDIVLLPGGHHVSYIAWSPRSLYVSRVIQAWCTQLYVKNK